LINNTDKYSYMIELIIDRMKVKGDLQGSQASKLEFTASNKAKRSIDVKFDLSSVENNNRMYDVMERWSLVLDVGFNPYNLKYTSSIYDKYYAPDVIDKSKELTKMGILNSLAEPCILRNNGSFIKSYLTRSIFSLRDDGIFLFSNDEIVMRSSLLNSAILKPISMLYPKKTVSENEFSNPLIYAVIMEPLLRDLGIWYSKQIKLDYKTIALIKVQTTSGDYLYHARLFVTNFNYQSEDNYVDYDRNHARSVIKYAVHVVINLELSSRELLLDDVDSLIDKVAKYYYNKLEAYLKDKNVLTKKPVPITIDNYLDDYLPKISGDVKERDEQFQIATLYPPNKRLSVALLYAGVNLLYTQDGYDKIALINSVSHGDDYLLSYITRDRLNKFMEDYNRALSLLDVSSRAIYINVRAFIHIIYKDSRKDKQLSHAYKVYTDTLLKSIMKYDEISVDDYIRRALLIEYKAPGYTKFI